MKKLLLSLSLVVLLIMAMPFCAYAEGKDYVVDTADLIFDANEEELENQLKGISEEIGMDVVFVTTDTLDGKTPEAYADDYYDYNGYADDGCLFLVSMEDRDWHISTKGYAITCITDYGVKVFEEECVGSLSNGDYYLAGVKYGNIVKEMYNEAKANKPYDTNNLYKDADGNIVGVDGYKKTFKGIAISLIAALIVAFIVMKSVKSSYKPVKFNRSAANYLVDGSLVVTQGYEHFLYSNVSRTARNDSSSSGGGSSTHSSSSGSSHGGGGGKF
ncbi:MAG: TPM domain-containing protein [Eubacterium sp.]|nr:TPM domain-containing protein [Eubacterium sp.]